ncbi:amino acid adenylation domain-containing protein [Plantactinospora sp. GCM10030261]|uniref:amino acid adenylation domain-containing protein n=1 Tax=Plantactinospora sp. GCM10030261 TaxID=3273420 RepID=UPI003622696E
MFGDVVERHPTDTSLVHNGRALTYSQLGALAGGLARRLGPRPGVVAVPATHDPGTIIALLGVWAAGGTYCPVDPGFPALRREGMRAAAGCRVTLSAADLPVDTGTAPPTEHRGWHPLAPVDPDDAAYVLFTSGSTGTPKPVAIPHRALAAAVPGLHDLFGLTPADRVLQFASLNWDTSFEEILPTLVSGATLVIDDETHTGSFPRFLRAVAAQRITVLDLPTAFWHELVHHLVESDTGLPPSVRLVVIGGEPASPARLADWCRLDTGRVRLLNTYGCTETTMITHAVDLAGPAGAVEAVGTPVPIGRALPHVRERLTPDGELLIGGPAVALGYRGLPRETADRFRLDDDGSRWFATGDRMRRLPDGTLLPVGRLDDQVKIRGIRVDPAEVEVRVAEHPTVAAVAVVGVPVAGRTALTAYVVPRAGAETTDLDLEIIRFLGDRVPRHLVPSRVSIVAELVHTASGKVDRAATHRRHTTHRVKEVLHEHR